MRKIILALFIAFGVFTAKAQDATKSAINQSINDSIATNGLNKITAVTLNSILHLITNGLIDSTQAINTINAQKGLTNGIASLVGGTVPVSQLPPTYDTGYVLNDTTLVLQILGVTHRVTVLGKAASLINDTLVSAWGNIKGNIASQQDLTNLLNLKLGISDTSKMLSVYAHSADVVKYADTVGMLAGYVRLSSFTPAGIGLGSVLNRKQVINLGGWDSAQVLNYAGGTGFPSASAGPTFVYAPDSNAFYYNNKTAYNKIAGGGGSGGVGGDDSTLMLSKHQAIGTYVPLTSWTSSGIIAALAYIPYNASNPNGYINGNQSISFAPGGGSDLTGSTSGSTVLNPVLTIVANAVTYGKMQQNAGKSIVGNSLAGVANNRAIAIKSGLFFDADSLKVDTTLLQTKNASLVYLQMQDTRTTNPNTLPSGPGTRFEWIPSLASLRVGSVTGNKWDSVNIGRNSFSLGIDNLITGNFGANFAAGDSNTINNVAGATAIGINNLVQGYDATAIGANDTATGGGAVALGTSNKASVGQGAVAIGNRNYASAQGAVTIGQFLAAHNPSQVAMGMYNDSTNGALAFMLGWGNSSGRKNIFTIDSTGLTTLKAPPLIDNSSLAITSAWAKSNFLQIGGNYHLYVRSASGLGDTAYVTAHDSSLVIAGIVDSAGFHHYIQNGRLVMYASNTGGTLTADTASIYQVVTATGDTIKVNTTSVTGFLGQKIFLAPYSPTSSGIMTAAKGRRLDSTIVVNNIGVGHNILRAPWTKDSLWARRINVEDTTGTLNVALRLSQDTTKSLDFNISFPSGTIGQIWTIQSNGKGGWSTPATGGSVTSVGLSLPTAMFSLSGTNPITTSGTFNVGLTSASAYTVWGDSSGFNGTPFYYEPNSYVLNKWFGGTIQGQLAFPFSIVNSGGSVILSGDAATPGNSMYYGTSQSGTKGFWALPVYGNGTMTSLGIAIPSTLLSVSGSPVTTNGTITLGLANASAHSYWGNNTASTGVPGYVTNTALTADLNLFTTTLKGLVPASGGGTTNFMRADGTWAPPAGTIYGADGTTLSISGNTFSIAATYSGQTTITKVGNITTGSWSAAAIGTAFGGLPAGGTARQFIVKNSSTNYDESWGALQSSDIPNNAANTSGSAGSLSAASALPNGMTATTQLAGDNTLKVATDQFVTSAISGFAPLASPVFTGIPQVPTAPGGTNSLQAASTAFVTTAIGNATGGITFNNGQQIVIGSSTSGVMSNNISSVTFNDFTSKSTYSLTMMSSPVDGQIVWIYGNPNLSIGTTAVTTFSLVPNAGQSIYMKNPPTTLVSGDVYMMRWSAPLSAWLGAKF